MSVKWTDLLLRLGTRIPLNMGERAVLLAVCFRADDAGECGFSKADIAAQMGMTKQNIQRIFARLHSMHLVERRIPHGISLCTAALEAYSPAPVGSGRAYAGKDENLKKTVIRESTEVVRESTAVIRGSTEVIRGSTEGEDGGVETGDGNPREYRAVVRESTESNPREYPIYKTNIEDTQTRVRVRAEAVPASRGAATPTPPQDDDRVIVSGGHTRPAVPEDFRAAAAFRRAYPKPPRDLVAFKAAWAAMERDGFGDGLPFEPTHLMAALERAKASKAWQEEGGRFVPRPEVFIAERQYLQHLTATERTPPAQRNARAMAGLESVLASMAHCGFTKEELARLRAKATPHVLAGMAPDRAVERVMAETSTTERI